MKRSITSGLLIGVALMVAGCGSPAVAPRVAETATDGWVTGPRVERVVRSAGFIVVGGTAAPLGRVILTAADGVAYAAGADEQGHFDVRVPSSGSDTLLSIAAQVGQIAYPAPYRLLVAADPAGPVALLATGAPSRRLDGNVALDAIDTDGQGMLLSGRARPGEVVTVVHSGSRTVTADGEGRWSLPGSADPGAPVQVAGRVYALPSGGADAEGVLERAGAGWRIGWTGSDGGRQVTWFPNAAPTTPDPAG